MELSVESFIAEVQKRPILWNKHHVDYKNRSYTDMEWGSVAECFNTTKDAAKNKWRSLRDVFLREYKKAAAGSTPDVYKGKWRYFSEMAFLKETVMFRDVGDVLSVQDLCVQDITVHDSDSGGDRLNYGAHHDGNTPPRAETPAFNNAIKHEVSDFPSSPSSSINFPTSTLKRRASAKRKKSSKKMKVSSSSFEQDFLTLEAKKVSILQKCSGDQEGDTLLFLRSLAPFLEDLSPLARMKVRNKIQSVVIEAMEDQLSTCHASSSKVKEDT